MVEQIAGASAGSGDLKPATAWWKSAHRPADRGALGQPTVREALVALEHQGLVVRKANQGCVVTVLTRAEISADRGSANNWKAWPLRDDETAPIAKFGKLGREVVVEMQEVRAQARDLFRVFSTWTCAFTKRCGVCRVAPPK